MKVTTQPAHLSKPTKTPHLHALAKWAMALSFWPTWLVLFARKQMWIGICRPFQMARSPFSVKWGLDATRRFTEANNAFHAYDGKMFRASINFPSPGWAARGHLDTWGVDAPLTHRQTSLLNDVLVAPELDWSSPEGAADLNALLEGKARFAAHHNNSAMAGQCVVDSIPPSRPDLVAHFRRRLSDLDPDWHTRDVHTHPFMMRLCQKEDWVEGINNIKLAQEAFMQREQIAGALSDPTPGSKPLSSPSQRL